MNSENHKMGKPWQDVGESSSIDRHFTVFVSKFDLKCDVAGVISQTTFDLPRISRLTFWPALFGLIWRTRKARAIFVSNPHIQELGFIYLAKLIYGKSINTFVFDLILRVPTRWLDKVLLPIKRKFLSAIDTFIVIHKEVSGYERHYGIERNHCEYVPFKANNIDLVGSVLEKDGAYVLALGASQRDYELLINAVDGSECPVKIVLSQASAVAHNAKMRDGPLPKNVERIDWQVDRLTWNKYIAESRIVVVPIISSAIQPAGISVYLEAMAFGKPVIVTQGASTVGLLDDAVARLVPPGDVGALRTAIERLWNDSRARDELSGNGRKYALSLGTHDRLVEDIRRVISERCVQGR